MKLYKILAVLAALSLVLAACGSDDDDSTGAGDTPADVDTGGDDTPADTDTDTDDTPADADTDGAASIDTPSDGDTVSNPVVLEVSASGIEIAPAADLVEGAGHFHVMIDTDCLPEGETIPKDDQHVHFGDGSTELDLGELAPGEHTLCLQVGSNDHLATTLTDEITITVEA